MTGFDPTQPYNDLPNLPPKQELESKNILKACIEARSALAELKQAAELLPNQDVLINTLPLLEAQASSEIENIVTTTDELFKFSNFDSDSADSSTKEALRYRQALYQGYASIKKRPLCTATAIDIAQTIKATKFDIRKVPGTALKNMISQELVYTPPVGAELLREKLHNWELFLHEQTGIDPLIRMAVGHYQFEAIHPFADGNGRTGRILNILFLIEQGILTLPILYLSRYIIQSKQEYYRLLLSVTREENWEEWILYMLHACAGTARWTHAKIRLIHGLMFATQNQIKQQLPEIYSYELIELLFQQPYCRISNLVEADIAKRQTASIYLKKLTERGILTQILVGREKLFVNQEYMRILKFSPEI